MWIRECQGDNSIFSEKVKTDLERGSRTRALWHNPPFLFLLEMEEGLAGFLGFHENSLAIMIPGTKGGWELQCFQAQTCLSPFHFSNPARNKAMNRPYSKQSPNSGSKAKAEGGRNIPLSLPRRVMLDLLAFAKDIPTVPVQRVMSLARVAAARAQPALAPERPGWCAIFTKAFRITAGKFPELRRAYLSFPLLFHRERNHHRASHSRDSKLGLGSIPGKWTRAILHQTATLK
jgi:hypothetical protein